MPGVDSWRKEVTITVSCGSMAMSTTKYTKTWHRILGSVRCGRGSMGLSADME